ncbi:protein kinase domain-containing protein [Gemmatimonas groenlandica]|uniref:non-specific serine/threonine protein kinase n=1 Tax=Gemmatimonas groenlandica TaxID=2732249 RepID=A0A6M4IP64_9BACT|nr:serine/threonine-protein kinase [Gemmatimonas groenlandica]QJR36530.1 protein kinase [Gemmatimonas groenlandica]
MSSPHARLADAIADRYTILREVGEGGMATVFLAEDRKHDRKVALKVLKPELAAALGADRFPREIKTVAQFNHPHILSLYDSGEVQGFLFYVMPYVEGESLRERLDRDKQLPVNDVVRIMHEVADALAYSHARGVVHRDIKPGNVLLSGRHAVVTDFGVAKAVSASGNDKATTTGMAVGTPQYMAPEQAMGEVDVDHRADIYALGLLGYEMLAGRPTFDAPSAQGLLAAHVMAVPADIQTLRPDTPPLLAAAIMRCLAKQRDDRWASADELLAQLEQIPSAPTGGMTPAQTAPHKATAVRPASRRGALIGIATAVLVLGGAAGALYVNRNSTSDSARIEKMGVMPIEDISGKDSLFVAAMHDALTSALTRANVGAVASRSAMMRYNKSSKTTEEIAGELALGAIVETTVFRAGDIMRINVQLSDPVTTRVIWSDTYERNVSNVLAAQSEVVALVATGIGGALSGTKTLGERK